MPDAPRPITSPPAQPFQPYDAQAGDGGGDPQTQSGAIYDAAGSLGGNWVKIRQGGRADMSTGAANPHEWPSDGASDGSAWKQT